APSQLRGGRPRADATGSFGHLLTSLGLLATNAPTPPLWRRGRPNSTLRLRL
ncbi:hypothetical protein NHX12_031646, partial [Muraenolepis orangiensis]